MDHIDPICPFDASQYTGTPDAEPCAKALPVPERIARLDALYQAGREQEAGQLLERSRAEAAELGDWRGELAMLSELMGYYRRSMEEEKGLRAVADGLALIREHRMGATVSGATVMLNAATTMKCFGRAGESLPVFRHVARVYGENLAPEDYRFAGLYNNMALSYADVGDGANAERHFRLAMRTIERCPNPENELAVTLCNLAELYDRQDAEDPRIPQCMEQAWEYLNSPTLPRDGYHAFTVSKCLPTFDYFGYFLYTQELRERVREIYEGA
ncbi:MAG: tetratricopeptide repeat protein [Oscillospiraceae bacterium]|jgi:hypothetical protein|nr:tetratricopeptide repeat protein [Oscillospiraceae bacterium]